jgi:hypothetical protein
VEDKELERLLEPIIEALCDLEDATEHRGNDINFAYLDAAQFALQRMLDPGSRVIRQLVIRGKSRI